MVGVAQLVEPRIVIPVVVGSSPIVHPILSLPAQHYTEKHQRRFFNITYRILLDSCAITLYNLASFFCTRALKSDFSAQSTEANLTNNKSVAITPNAFEMHN